MTSHPFRTRLRRNLSRLIGWFFGAFWATLGALALPRPYEDIGCVLAALTAIIFLMRLWRYKPNADAARPHFRMSIYGIAVFAELLGIYVAALVLPRMGASQQVYPVVGCIVGLHFIGLWLATRSERFLHITVGMCLVSVFSMIMPFTWHTIGLRYLLLGAGNAIVLWLAASGSD
jgi:hypothetical protein